MSRHPSSAIEGVRQELASLPEGALLSSKAFLHLGTRAAIDQALSRLARRGEVLRIERGLYTKPIETRFGKRPPSIHLVLQSITAATGEAIEPAIAGTANALGFTTQVPVRQTFLTSGRARRLRVGNQVLELRKARRWQIGFNTPQASEAIRALTWLHENGSDERIGEIVTTLSPAARSELLGARRRMPAWMAKAVSVAAHV